MAKPTLDLNLYLVLESLYQTLNVSKTAKELNLSQSAISHSLTRLRDHFNDPLFVRVSKGVAPTDLALSLRQSVEDFCNCARELGTVATPFDPMLAKRRITIASTDMLELLVIPQVLNRLKKEAPGIQLSLRPTGSALPKEEMEKGNVDIAVAGFYKNLPEGFYQTKIWDDHFMSCCRKDHPHARKLKSDKKVFFEVEHALLTLEGDFKDQFQKAKKPRMVSYGSFSFSSIAWTIAKTDLVLTGPARLIKTYSEYFPLATFKPPIELSKIEQKMVWHGLTHRDPLLVWFREIFKEELEKLDAPVFGE